MHTVALHSFEDRREARATVIQGNAVSSALGRSGLAGPIRCALAHESAGIAKPADAMSAANRINLARDLSSTRTAVEQVVLSGAKQTCIGPIHTSASPAIPPAISARCATHAIGVHRWFQSDSPDDRRPAHHRKYARVVQRAARFAVLASARGHARGQRRPPRDPRELQEQAFRARPRRAQTRWTSSRGGPQFIDLHVNDRGPSLRASMSLGDPRVLGAAIRRRMGQMGEPIPDRADVHGNAWRRLDHNKAARRRDLNQQRWTTPAERVRRVAGATRQVAARVRRVARVAGHRLGELAAIRDHDVVLADAKLLAAERADRHGDTAREARRARRLGDAIAIAVGRALRGAQTAVPRREHAARRQVSPEGNAKARTRHAVE